MYRGVLLYTVGSCYVPWVVLYTVGSCYVPWGIAMCTVVYTVGSCARRSRNNNFTEFTQRVCWIEYAKCVATLEFANVSPLFDIFFFLFFFLCARVSRHGRAAHRRPLGAKSMTPPPKNSAPCSYGHVGSKFMASCIEVYGWVIAL